MFAEIRKFLYEFVRCTRHNILHLRLFRISYGRGVWHVSDGQVSMTFPHYPYLAFHDIEGYLNEGKWRPEAGMTVIDAGGCFGEFTVYASKRVGPTGRVLMLEPDPGNIEVAERVFELNGNPANIQIVPAGLWSSDGKLRFAAGHDAQSAVVTDASDATSDDTIEIEVYSLPSLMQRFGLDRLDFVKMDVEGAELEIVSAVGELPSKIKPRYAIASYHVVDGRKTAESLPRMFEQVGYHCQSGYPDHLTTWASPA
jgi:FkbM family methyltransferase